MSQLSPEEWTRQFEAALRGDAISIPRDAKVLHVTAKTNQATVAMGDNPTVKLAEEIAAAPISSEPMQVPAVKGKRRK